jgi:hypothetical protein
MDSNEFVSWLRGFIDASGVDLSVTQLNKVKEKLEDVREVYCPQQIQPTQPYSPPWTIGDQPHDPNNPYKIWYTTSTGVNPSLGVDPEEYN